MYIENVVENEKNIHQKSSLTKLKDKITPYVLSLSILAGAYVGCGLNPFISEYDLEKYDLESRTKIAFLSNRDGDCGIYVMNTDGSNQTKLTDNLTYHLETAWQLGRGLLNPTTGMIASSAKRRAFAVETAASMNFPDTKYVPSLTALYAYFSGQKGDVNKKIKAWDPMYEDQKFGDIANAQIPQSNAHILGVIGTMKPTDDVTLMGEYYAYWWDKKYGDDTTTPSVTTARGDQLFMDHDKFAGSELDLKAIYDYTEDVQIALMTGLFFPGGSFDDRNDSIATEVIGSMKVTF